MDKTQLLSQTLKALKTQAQELGLKSLAKKTKSEIINLIIEKSTPIVEKPSKSETKKPTAKISKPILNKKKPQAVKLNTPEPKQLNQSKTPDIASNNKEAQPPKLPESSSNKTENKELDKKPQQTTQNTELKNNHRRNQNLNPNQHKNHNNNSKQPQTLNTDQNERKEPQFRDESTIEVSGILEVMSDGTHGVLRSPKLIASDKDTYISISQVKKFRLRKGDFVRGIARLPKENERYYSLLWIKDVNDITVDKLQNRPNFDDFKPVYPDKQIKLEFGQYPISNRIIDMLAPIGFGQRSMIVAQPKSGKTFLLKDIAKGINENHPNVQLMVVLIGERPEEVTDIERSVKGIVYASNFDDSPANQVAVAELSLERAKRMVELGKDVIILMDSLTRLARAYNVALPASGRTLSGGLDPISLYPSKRFFGAARNFENGASLTIVATSLVDTGSKMDEVIFEEFKGTGNMEIKLDRRLANKRVFPAIDIKESGTRNEDLLLGSEEVRNSWQIRRMLDNLGQDANEAFIDKLKISKSNEEFMQNLHQY